MGAALSPSARSSNESGAGVPDKNWLISRDRDVGDSLEKTGKVSR